jgi:hypothetical protein
MPGERQLFDVCPWIEHAYSVDRDFEFVIVAPYECFRRALGNVSMFSGKYPGTFRCGVVTGGINP